MVHSDWCVVVLRFYLCRLATGVAVARLALAAVAVAIYATPEARFEPEGMAVSAVVGRCTKLEITVTEPGTIGVIRL